MKIEDYYNKDNLLDLKSWLEEGNYENIKAYLFFSKQPGTGKTSGTYLVAKTLGFNVMEFNMSDYKTSEWFERLKVISELVMPEKTLILLDEVDGVENVEKLVKIIRNTINPIIMTSNDVKTYNYFKDVPFVKCLYFRPPPISMIVSQIKKKAKTNEIKLNYENIRGDWRLVETVSLGGSGYESYSKWDALLDVLNGRRLPKKLTQEEKITMLDTIIDNTLGYYTWRNVKILEAYDKIKSELVGREVIRLLKVKARELSISPLLKELKRKGETL